MKIFVKLMTAFFCFYSFAAFSDTDVSPEEYRILFLGDSLTEGYGIDEDKTYVSLLEKKWESEGRNIQVFNGSVSGSTTSSAMSRLRWFERVSPTHLVLALGANDGLRGLSVQSTQKNLEEAIEWALSRDITVVLAGMLMPPNYGREYTEEFEKMFSSLAKKHAVYFIPFLLEGVAAEEKYNLPDGIHPNEKGHELMKKNVQKFLNPLLGITTE